MATCDFCGTYFTFGALKTGRHSFCSGACQDRGRVLQTLDQLSTADLDRYVNEAHHSICQSCKEQKSIDVRRSHWVWSAGFVTRWGSTAKVECAVCSRPRQLKALLLSLLVGWWGVPFGVFITPVQVVRNIKGLVGGRTGPSPELRRIVLLKLAQRLQRRSVI
jgi:hypothetical protein